MSCDLIVRKSMDCKGLDIAKKKKHKKGLWSPDEDQKLMNYILNHGLQCWSSVPINAGISSTNYCMFNKLVSSAGC